MSRTKAFIWRIVFAAIFVVVLFFIFPLFMDVIGFSIPAKLDTLLRACVGILALLYVAFGPNEFPTPF